MRIVALSAVTLFIFGCNQAEDAAYRAPYPSVSEPDAPTVASLQGIGYTNVDSYPVGCEIPGQPDAACDATGAVFLDLRAFPENEMAVEDEGYSRYEFVCPAIDNVDVSKWRCRKQGQKNG